MAPQKTHHQRKDLIEKLNRTPSKENLIFAGILVLVTVLLIVTAIVKHNQAQEQALFAKTSTALANNVCPACGQWGTPTCAYCRFAMQWNNAQSLYVCPRCQVQGAPYCPGCRRPVPMQSRGVIGCIPQNPGFSPQYTVPQQNGGTLVA